MFVSGGLELKLHSPTEEGLENHTVYNIPSTSKIINVSLCNDNSYIAFLRQNEKPQILSAKDKQNMRLIHTINVVNVSAITFKHNTKKNIAMGIKNGDVVMYDTKARAIYNVFPKISDTIKFLDFTCDDQHLCCVDKDILFVFLDINSNTNDIKMYKQKAECTCLKCHSFIPNRAAIGCQNGNVSLWDVQSGTELLNIELLTSPVSGIAMSSCGNFLIASGKELKICGLDFVNRNSTFQVQFELERPASSMDLSPDDKFLAVGLHDGTVKLYDIKQHMKQIYCGQLHDGPVNRIVFENKAKELNSNFASMHKLSDQELKESVEDSSNSASTIKNNVSKINETREESLEKMKRSLLKVIKSEMDSLENQLQEHCVKFQKFLDNEFETIDNILKKKWDIFNAGDVNQIISAICPEESKTTCS